VVSELWKSKLAIDLAIGLYKIVISQQIKKVIANEHEKLNKLMIAQTLWLLPAKILKLADPRRSYSVLHQCRF